MEWNRIQLLSWKRHSKVNSSNCLTSSGLNKRYCLLLRSLSKCYMNTDRHWVATTSRRRRFHFFYQTHSKEMFPNALSEPLLDTTLCCSYTSCHQSLRRGDWHFPFIFHFSGSFREQWSRLSVSSSPGWATGVLSFSSQDMISSTITSFVSLLWMLSSF